MAHVLEPNLASGFAPKSSDRSFGFVLAIALGLVGCWPLLHREFPRWWVISTAAAIALVAMVQPTILHSLNRTWGALGRLLHQAASPIAMGVIFFLCVTPIGWIMRLLGKDVLSLARRSELSTYWITRDNSPPEAETFKNQF
jgi:hypothetical protein